MILICWYADDIWKKKCTYGTTSMLKGSHVAMKGPTCCCSVTFPGPEMPTVSGRGCGRPGISRASPASGAAQDIFWDPLVWPKSWCFPTWNVCQCPSYIQLSITDNYCISIPVGFLLVESASIRYFSANSAYILLSSMIIHYHPLSSMKTYYINPNKRHMKTSLQTYENTILPLFPPWQSMAIRGIFPGAIAATWPVFTKVKHEWLCILVIFLSSAKKRDDNIW